MTPVSQLSIVRADRFAARLRGLIGRSQLPADCALWLVPCNAVHTFGMRFAIDAVFIDRNGVIVSVRHGLAPGRLACARNARSVVELAAGVASSLGLKEGDRWPLADARGSNCLRRFVLACAHLLLLAGLSTPLPSDAQSEFMSSQSDARLGQDIPADRERAEQAYREQRYNAAAEAFARLAQAAPGDAQAWLRLGNALERNDDTQRALIAYETAAGIALPPRTQFGFLEATQRRGKALLNIARLLLLLSRQALTEYERNGSAHAQFSDVAAESARHGHLLQGAITRLRAAAEPNDQ